MLKIPHHPSPVRMQIATELTNIRIHVAMRFFTQLFRNNRSGGQNMRYSSTTNIVTTGKIVSV